VANTLAYYGTELNQVVKGYIVHPPGVNHIKLLTPAAGNSLFRLHQPNYSPAFTSVKIVIKFVPDQQN